MRRMLSIVFSEFPMDARPRREAEAFVEHGFEVDMICLKAANQPAKETLYGVNVHRINIERRRESKSRYIWEYVSFLCISFVMASRMHLKKRYDVVHVHNMPDFLVFSALIPKMMKAKVILDLHDPMPELFMTKYHIGEHHKLIKALILIEQLSIKFSDLVITPNKAFKEVFVARGCPEEKVTLIMNSPMENILLDPNVAKKSEKIGAGHGFKIMFHGFFTEHNGLDLALEAVSNIKHDIPGLVLKIFGNEDHFPSIREKIHLLGLQNIVELHPPVDLRGVAENIMKCDLGIVSSKKTPFTELNFPTRLFEFLALQKPVVAPKTRGISDYFSDEEMCFFEAGNQKDLERKIVEIYRNPEYAKSLVSRGEQIYRKNCWKVQKEKLVNKVLGMLGDKPKKSRAGLVVD